MARGPGVHTLSALWKRPDGQIDSISPDVKIEENTDKLTCYWTYELSSDMRSGVWTVEVRIDGQPAGSHSFEIAGTVLAKAPTMMGPKPPSLDQIYRNASRSLVWVRRMDSAGKLVQTATGFVLDRDRIITAFQAIDGAAKLQIEFAGGNKIETDKILACSRMGDWAVVSANTAGVPDLQSADPAAVVVGERLIAFDAEGDTRTISSVDVTGRRVTSEFGERIQFSPGLTLQAAGGPLLSTEGQPVAILGGSVTPGAGFNAYRISVNPALGIGNKSIGAATPLSVIREQKTGSVPSLAELASSGVLTPLLADMEGLLYVTTSLEMPKTAADPLPRDVGEFSKHDKQVYVISEWQKSGRISKGVVSAKVYDAQNRVRVVAQPKRISLSSSPTRSGFGFPVAQCQPGVYRIDLTWDDQPVWRTFIRIND